MARYRDQLPQLSGELFLTDSGLETSLIYHDGLVLPDFAAFALLKDSKGTEAIRRYFRQHATIPADGVAGIILESPTWRANTDWGKRLAYGESDLDIANRKAIAMLDGIRNELKQSKAIVISGCIGPRGDGYRAENLMTEDEAGAYHQPQIDSFAETEADLVSALTMNYTAEAIGVVRAAKKRNVPVVISFTVETDGRLPSGVSLGEAIQTVDDATDNGPIYYMINCAHPTHFADTLSPEQPWINRLRGLRANASCLNHAELDEATELDDGNPEQLGAQFRELRDRLPHLNVLGGCCGTDERHIRAIMEHCSK